MFRFKKLKMMFRILSIAVALPFAVAGAVSLSAGVAYSADNFAANLETGDFDRFLDVKVTPDGGYVTSGAAGADGFVQVTKFNKYGNLDWSKEFDGVEGGNMAYVDVNEDGYIFVSGYVNAGDPVPVKKSLWVAKLKCCGTVIWEKLVTNDADSSRGLWLAATQDGGCIVSSQYTYPENSKDWTVFKLSGDGAIEWGKCYGTEGFNVWCHVLETINPDTDLPDGYLLANYDKYMSATGKNDVVLIKTNLSGNIVWAKNYAPVPPTGSEVDTEFLKNICQTSDGGYAIVGQSYTFKTQVKRLAFLLKVDKNGDFSWARVFGCNMDAPTGHDFTNAAVSEAVNGDLILTGLNYNCRENKDAWLLRFTSGGDLRYDRIYPGDLDDILDNVACTADNGGIAVGYSKSYGAGNKDAYIIKFNQDLRIIPGSGDPACGGIGPNSPCEEVMFVVDFHVPHEIELTDWFTIDWDSVAPLSWEYFYMCAEDNDSDGDDVFDHRDNCALTANPDQQDTDGDGCGNACDCDLDNDCVVGPSDFGLFKSAWFSTPDDPNWNPDADFDSNNAVGPSDFGILKSKWFTSYPWY
jgi:hypothetical protein